MSTQPPIEDINAIVNRFQAWAGAQAPARSRDGVRELTYDEAIRSRRPRSSSEVPSPETKKSARDLSVNAKAGTTRTAAKPKKRVAAPRHVRDAPRPVQTKPAVAAATPAFRQVLAEKVAILPAAAPQELAIERRTTALSLRISLTEHELLKRRAAEANLSVSCYLRNCVFEVEDLRARLATAVAEPKLIQVQPSARISTFTSCFRFVRQLFFRKTTSLAVRV
jgi:hypothetical protein